MPQKLTLTNKQEMPPEVLERFKELSQKITQYTQSYYGVDDPIKELEISDADFDLLVIELKKIEATYPEFEFKDSPSQKVGAAGSTLFEGVKHSSPMISLDNAFDEQELSAWLGRLLPTPNRGSSAETLFEDTLFEDIFFEDTPEGIRTKHDKIPQMVCEPKFDGFGVAVVYKDGRLRQGATRGDGVNGENITENIVKVTHMPKQLKGDYPVRLEIRGEIYLPITEFERLNEIRQIQGKKPYANPRNVAAGSIRIKNPALVVLREISWWCYQLVEATGMSFKTHSESLEYLKSLGLPVNPSIKTVKSYDEILTYLKKIEKDRNSYDYEVDGAVIKLDDLNAQEQAGSTSHHPRWAIAYKFPPEEKITRLLDIRVSIGTKGKVTPFASLEPVFVGGSTVRVATLHNEDQVAEKDVRPGDMVVVRKAGDIIPEVIRSVPSQRKKNTKPWAFPKLCPCSNKVKLVRPEGDSAHHCPEKDCPFQQTGRIEHFASKGAMDIEGVGEKWIQTFVEEGLITDVADLYFLNFENIWQQRNLKGRIYGKKNAAKLEKSIKASKKQPLSKLLYGLSIPNIGVVASKDIAEEFGSLDAIIALKPEDFEKIYGIGEIQSKSICEFMNNPKKKSVIKKLRKAGMNFKQPKPKVKSQELGGKSFVFTGGLLKMNREDAKDKVVALGGKMQTTVSSNTDYVVIAKSGGSKTSKQKKAEELGITQLNEQEFLKLLSGK